MNWTELVAASELVAGSILALEVIRLRTRKPPVPEVNLCECEHASAFHGDKGCRATTGKKTVDAWASVTWEGCGCQRFTRKGTFYDPNTESDLERLDRLAKLDEVQRVKRIIPFSDPSKKRKGL